MRDTADRFRRFDLNWRYRIRSDNFLTPDLPQLMQFVASRLLPGMYPHEHVRKQRSVVFQVLQPARAALLRRIGGDRFDLRFLRLSNFLVRPLLTFRHRASPSRRTTVPCLFLEQFCEIPAQ